MLVIPTLATLEPQVDSGSLRPVGSAEPGADFFSLFLFSALSSLGEGEGEAPEKSPAPDEPGSAEALSASQTGALPFIFPLLLFTTSVTGAVPPAGQAGDPQAASSQGTGMQPVPNVLPALPGQALQTSPGDLPQTSSEAVSQVPAEEVRQLQGLAEKESSAPELLAQQQEQPAVHMDQTLNPVAQDSPAVSPRETRFSPASLLSPTMTMGVHPHGLTEQGEAEQESGTAQPSEDEGRNGLGVPLARLLEANGRTEGLAAAPLLLTGEGNRPAGGKEDSSALSLRLLSGEGQVQTFTVQSLSAQHATPSAQRPAETWQAVLAQVAGGVSASLRHNSQEARIQLEPPELGKLKIDLVLEGGRVHARIVTESADVGALIQNHLPELKQALQSHSLDLDTVRVDVNSGGGEQGDFARGFQQDLGARGGRGDPGAFSQWTEKAAEESGGSARSRLHGSVSVWA